jgi:undecaprenyl diphosphate synthase
MHVGFIMDGNRRWAKKGNFLPYFGHNAGGETLEKILQSCPNLNIDTVTIYALSTENLQNRSGVEVIALNELIRKMASSKKKNLVEKDTHVKVIGELEALPKSVKKALVELEEATADCSSLKLQICINYGGRQEILNSVKKTIEQGQELSEDNISKNLYSSSQPDLIIRTGGRQRLSNFLLWQGAYSELYFTDKLWPDFDEEELKSALDFFHSQERNFGK